jgi:Fe2+ or Zn2+ uptake regulation protein
MQVAYFYQAPHIPMKTPSYDFTVEGVLALLRGRGLRITRSRRGIMLALFKASRPLSLQEIQTQAETEGGQLPDYATVFRMMILLESLGAVHKVNLQRSCTYYELTDPMRQHEHLICTDCGKVILLDVPSPVSELEHQLALTHGFTGLRHSLEFFGKCPECSAVSLPVAEPTSVATPIAA